MEMPTPPKNNIHNGAGAAAASSLLALVPIVQMLTSGPIALLQNTLNNQHLLKHDQKIHTV